MNEPSQPQSMGPSRPGVITPWLLITFIIVLLGGGGYLGWWYYSNHKTTTPTTTTPSTVTPTITTPTTPTTSTAEWKTYTNTDYGFSLKYPENWNGQGNKSITNDFTWSANDGELSGVTLNVYLEKIDSVIAPIKSNSANTISSKQVGLNTWTSADIVQNDKEHSPASFSYYLENNGKTYQIIGEKTNKNIIDQILSTFQFSS